MRFLICLIAFTSFLVPASLRAQTEFDETKLIPSSAMAAVFVRPKTLLAEPGMELVPYEVLTELGKRELGFDPCEIVKAMFLVDSVTDLNGPPGFALVLAFDSDQSPGRKITEQLEEGTLKGKTVYRGGENAPVIYQPNSKTIVVGMEPFILKMLSAKGAESKLISLIKSRGNDAHLSAFVTLEPIRGIINENLPPKEQIPFPFQKLRSLPDLIDSLVVQLDYSEDPVSRFEVVAIDEPSVKEIEAIIKDGVAMGRSLAMEYIAQEMQDEDPGLQKAVQAYGKRAGDFLETHLLPTRSGKSLVFEGKGAGSMTGIATVGTLIGMLLPAVQQVREAARRTQSMNTLRQFALASLNYESAFKKFPSNIVDKDGNALLSWRVAILPFMEENKLYSQFRLDEPWDSEHNIQLLDQMPDLYGNPNIPELTNKTVFLAFEGEETMLSGKKIGFGNITDGSSNTILYVEANADAAIEWSRPKDIEFDPTQPVTQVGKLRPGGFNAAFCDGSVHFIANGIDWQVLSRLIQRADGQITGYQ